MLFLKLYFDFSALLFAAAFLAWMILLCKQMKLHLSLRTFLRYLVGMHRFVMAKQNNAKHFSPTFPNFSATQLFNVTKSDIVLKGSVIW